MPGVSSVQITFHEDKAPEHHAMPPGGFRLAIVNATSLEAGQAGGELLREAFILLQDTKRRRHPLRPGQRLPILTNPRDDLDAQWQAVRTGAGGHRDARHVQAGPDQVERRIAGPFQPGGRLARR